MSEKLDKLRADLARARERRIQLNNRIELLERRISPALEEIMEQRKNFVYGQSDSILQPVEGVERTALVAYPIISAGDVCGAILFLADGDPTVPTEAEEKLLQAAAGFLGKQMEE